MTNTGKLFYISACQTETQTAGIVIESLLTALSPWGKAGRETGACYLSMKQEEKAAPSISESTVSVAENRCLRGGTMLTEA